MIDSENQTTLDKENLRESSVLDRQTALLPKIKKSLSSYRLLRRPRALPPAIRKDILPAERPNRLPAVLLGALFIISLLSTDLSYWDSAVRAGTKFMTGTTNTIGTTYAYITKPLDYTLSKTSYLIKNTEQKNLATTVIDWGKLVGKGYGQVVKTLVGSEKQLAGKLEKTSQDSNLVLKQKSGNLSADLGDVKEKVAIRRHLLEARALTVFDNSLLWFKNLLIRLNQKISSAWTRTLLKADEVSENWRNFINPNKISPEISEEIKKAVTEEVAKNLHLQSLDKQEAGAVRNASYGAVVVSSSGDLTMDEKIKKDLKNQFSDEVVVNFDKSGQAGIITPVFEGGEKGKDYIFLLTPIKQ